MSPPYSLDELKGIAKASGSKALTGVALSLMSAALNDYGMDKMGSKRAADVRVMLPMYLKPKKSLSKELCNSTGGLFLRLPGRLDDDVARLKASLSRLSFLKKSPHVVVMAGLNKLMTKIL